MSQIEVKIIEHSISEAGKELITFQASYPRMVHSELMTHRVFSRNASSSRAIPVAKMIAQVRDNPAMPVHWGKNQPGMQAREELTGSDLERAQNAWRYAAENAARVATDMMDIGLHKQVANRILEPFQIIHAIITTTELDNFYTLREHEDADPNIYALASSMSSAQAKSTPILLRNSDCFSSKGWHLPYITQEERREFLHDARYLARLSSARCARVSYLTHDGQVPNRDKDLELYARLIEAKPMHASPVEHQAYPDRHPVGSSDWFEGHLHGNFNGWVQHRKIIEWGVQ